MKKLIRHLHPHTAKGLWLAAFGVFFLVANLVPNGCIMKFWPIFLIIAGLYKAMCCCDKKCKE